jgi:hypothetical protein
MGKQNVYTLEGVTVPSKFVQPNTSQDTSQSSGYNLEGVTVGDIATQKKNDTASSGQASSTGGSSNKNEGVDTGNLFTKFFRGINHEGDAAFSGVYDTISAGLGSLALSLDVANPRNWFANTKIAAALTGADLQSVGRKVSDMLSLDSEEINKQSKMSWKEKQDYLKQRYDSSIDKKEDFGFQTSKSSESGALPSSVGRIYEAAGYLQDIGDLSFKQTLEASGIKKEDIAKNKSVSDFIAEGNYADAAKIAALSAARTIPMSIALASTGNTAEVFAGSAILGTGSEVNKAYADDQHLSGSEIVKSIWSGLIEGTTESLFQTNLRELKRTGQALIGGSPIVEAVAEEGADVIKKQLVRGMIPAAKRIFRGAGEEGLEEILSTVGNFVVDKAQSTDQRVTLGELATLSKNAADAFIIGSLSGGGISGMLTLATSNKLDETQKKSISRLKEVANDQSLSDETRKIANDKIDDIMKYHERGAYDDYTAIASIEDVGKRADAIDALFKIETLQQDKKAAKDEAVQAGIDDKIQEKSAFVNGLMEEQWNKERDRHSDTLKLRQEEAKIKAEEFLANNNAYTVFQEDHADTMKAMEQGKDIEVSDLNKAADQLNEIEQVIHNNTELTPLEKDQALYKINGQIRSLETYVNATENGTRLTESQAEGRIATTGARALQRAQRVRNNRFKGEIFTAYDENGAPFQVTAQVNEKGQISLYPKPKFRIKAEAKEFIPVDNSIKIKGDLEVIDTKMNEDDEVEQIRVRDTKTGKEFTTNSPVLIPMLMANQAKRNVKFAPDRAYVVDENVEVAEANPILNKLTKEQRARLNNQNKALKQINPNGRIILFDNATEVAKALMEKGYSRKESLSKARESNALKVGEDVYVNRMTMQDNTVSHEIFHEAFAQIAVEFPEAFIQMQKRIIMVLPTNVTDKLQAFADLYAKDAKKATNEEKVTMAEEFLMELGGMMVVRDAKIQRGVMHKVMLSIREFLSKWAGKLKMKGLQNLINSSVFSETASIEELAKFFESLSESIRKGKKADLSYLANQLEQNRMVAHNPSTTTEAQEQEDVDALNEDFAGELFEPTNLNITGTLTEEPPKSKRKPKKAEKPDIKQQRGSYELMSHPFIEVADIIGKRYSVTMSDHTRVGEYRNDKSGVVVSNLMGGVFYPYIQGIRDAGIAWASVTPKAAREMVMNAINQDATLVYRMARSTGSRGNVNFNEIALAELIAPVTSGLISEEEFLKQLNNKLNTISNGKQLGAGKHFLGKYGKDSGNTITVNKTEVVQVADKNGKLKNKTVPVLDKDGKNIRIKAPRLEIKSIEQLKKGLSGESFSKRGGFWSTILKDSWNKKSTGEWYKFLEANQVTSIEDIVHGLAEQETDSANDHDIVAAIKIAAPEYTEDGLAKIYTTRKSLVDEKKGIFFIDAPDHPSYPYVVKGEPVGVFNEFHNVTEYFPIIKEWIKSKRLNSPYKAVETMGKELVASRETIKAQKVMAPVFHGGEVEDITTLENDKIFFVANDKEEALAYARDNEGNLIEINIDKSKIAPESEIRKILEDEFGLPYEYMIHELIDPRFEDTYIGDELASELFNRLEEEGYEGGEFMDSSVTGKSRNTRNMFIINPANTLSSNDYLNITLSTQSEAEELLKEGYRPLLPNGEVMESATNEDIEKLFSKTTNLINESKLQMVKPSEYTKYTQAKEGLTIEEDEISKEIEEKAVDSDQLQIQIKPQKILYHGSPWNFNKFESGSIGIGEGRQAFGWGMYFSTDINVAKSYSKANQGNKFRQMGLLDILGKPNNNSIFGNETQGLREKAYNLLQNTNTTLAQWKQFLEDNKGFLGTKISKANRNKLYQAFGERNLYKVAVDDRVNGLQDGFWLDWDGQIGYANASQILIGVKNTMSVLGRKMQDEAKAKKINTKKYLTLTDSYNIAESIVMQMNATELARMNGGQFYNSVTESFRSSGSYRMNKFDPQQMASMLLSSAGIDGNRLNTFATVGGRGDGHKNYIVFNSDAIKVIDKSTIKQQKNKESGPAYNVLSNQIASQEKRTGPSLIKAAKGIMNKDLTEFRNLTHATYRSLYKVSFDRMVNVRKEMEDSAFNRSMFLMFNKAGASQFGNFKFEKAFKRIYGKLTEADLKLLDTVIFLRRVVEVDTNFDNQRIELENKLAAIKQIIENDPSVKEDYADEIRVLKSKIKEKARPDHGKEGAITWAGKDIKANKETSLDTLDKMKNELGDEKYNDIVSRSDEYFKEFSEILNYKMKNGTITKEAYELFKNYNYSPRKFLDYAFGIEARDKDGKPTGEILLNSNQFFFRGSILSSEDIKNIKQGSETDFMMTDSRKLLQGAMIMAEVKVATNKMVKALAEDSQLTNQGWVKPMKYQTYNDGTIKTNPDGSYKYYEAEDGYRKMDYWMDGKKYSYQLREDLAREFLDEELRDLRGEEGSLRRGIYDWTTKLSGSQAVRFFATGINTGFFISNIPIDVASQVNVTDIYAGGVAGQYKQAMGGTLELSKRLLKMEMGLEDPYVEKLLQEYAESGGLMMSQTQEAMGKNIRSKFVEYLALFGNISEIASKLNSYRTVKNRLMDQYYDKNKQNPVGDDLEAIKEEAAYKARAAMDYHRGGLVSKMWDGYVPYFNVFTQGSFISWKYIKNNKVDFFNKIYKAGIALAGLTVYNMMVAGDDYDNDDVQMDLLNKIVIFMPWRNEDGKRAYIKISVPSIVKGWLNTFQHIGEGSYYKLVSDEPSRQAKWRAGVTERWIKGFTPSANSFVSVPVPKALMEYNFNYDLYRERPIFNEGSKPVSTGREGIDSEKVLEFYKIIGLATGFSPIKSQKAVEDIIPALNPLVQMGYAVTDKVIDSHNAILQEDSKYKLDEYQRSKFGKGDVGDMATSFLKGIKDRAVDYTDPKVKFPKNKDSFLAADEARGDVYQDLKAEVKMMSDNKVTPQQLGDKLKDKPFMEQKYGIDYYFMLKKRENLNFKDNFNEYSQFMFSADAKAKAEKLYQSSPLTNYLNPQNETEKKYMEDLIMLKVLDPATTLEYQNYFNAPKK